MGHVSSITVLVFVLSYILSLGSANIIPSSSAIVGFIQNLQDPRYRIKFPNADSGYQRDPDLETIVMTDGEKRKFMCTLPKSEENSNDEITNTSSVSLATERRVSKAPDDLLATLKDRCFRRHEGWWTYEFCYQGTIKQLHIDAKGEVEQTFVLGVYDAEATLELHKNLTDISLQKDHRSKTAAQKYHSHIYTNGTLCDLTNEPRQTEVRFVCADTSANMISSITEASTCRYTLVFHSAVLCKHPLFQEGRPQYLEINCVEMPPSVVDKMEDSMIITGLLPLSEDSKEQ